MGRPIPMFDFYTAGPAYSGDVAAVAATRQAGKLKSRAISFMTERWLHTRARLVNQAAGKTAQLEKNALTMRCGALATLAQRARYRATSGVFSFAKTRAVGAVGRRFHLLALLVSYRPASF